MRYCNIKFIAKGGFGKIYKAKWIDANRNWEVALKSLNNSKNVTIEFINEVYFILLFNKYNFVV